MEKLFEKESIFSFSFLIKVILWSIVPFRTFEFSGILPGECRGGLSFLSSSVVKVRSNQIKLGLSKPEHVMAVLVS